MSFPSLSDPSRPPPPWLEAFYHRLIENVCANLREVEDEQMGHVALLDSEIEDAAARQLSKGRQRLEATGVLRVTAKPKADDANGIDNHLVGGANMKVQDGDGDVNQHHHCTQVAANDDDDARNEEKEELDEETALLLGAVEEDSDCEGDGDVVLCDASGRKKLRPRRDRGINNLLPKRAGEKAADKAKTAAQQNQPIAQELTGSGSDEKLGIKKEALKRPRCDYDDLETEIGRQTQEALDAVEVLFPLGANAMRSNNGAGAALLFDLPRVWRHRLEELSSPTSWLSKLYRNETIDPSSLAPTTPRVHAELLSQLHGTTKVPTSSTANCGAGPFFSITEVDATVTLINDILFGSGGRSANNGTKVNINNDGNTFSSATAMGVHEIQPSSETTSTMATATTVGRKGGRKGRRTAGMIGNMSLSILDDLYAATRAAAELVAAKHASSSSVLTSKAPSVSAQQEAVKNGFTASLGLANSPPPAAPATALLHTNNNGDLNNHTTNKGTVSPTAAWVENLRQRSGSIQRAASSTTVSMNGVGTGIRTSSAHDIAEAAVSPNSDFLSRFLQRAEEAGGCLAEATETAEDLSPTTPLVSTNSRFSDSEAGNQLNSAAAAVRHRELRVRGLTTEHKSALSAQKTDADASESSVAGAAEREATFAAARILVKGGTLECALPPFTVDEESFFRSVYLWPKSSNQSNQPIREAGKKGRNEHLSLQSLSSNPEAVASKEQLSEPNENRGRYDYLTPSIPPSLGIARIEGGRINLTGKKIEVHGGSVISLVPSGTFVSGARGGGELAVGGVSILMPLGGPLTRDL